MQLGELAANYDSLVVLDVETSGLSPQRNEIIELAAARVEGSEVVERYDQFLQLSPGKRLDRRITELTGITQEDLEREGIPKEAACRDLQGLLSHGRTLLAAYNAQFDLAFLYRFLTQDGDPAALDAFTDASDLADYARTAAATLIQLQIVSGSDGQLTPKASLTRAQMARILYAALELQVPVQP